MTVKIFGIKNCDTMKKAFKFFEQHNIDFEFHDYKKQGLSEALAQEFIAHIPLETLVNKRGTTWRKLDDAIKDRLSTDNAAALMIENTSVIKRPIVLNKGQYLVGFNLGDYEKEFC
ncbi:ArsC family reductase [Pleionea litopenaei]|uniref:ArsC family reductase n=1 Tax=Pleionea litopenaei TaxID=3070815 RepID=A0AA51RT17_9GAMM|nr:ArsC family reductase [Pleionea sp. HL-JVS1]WMS86944.1 ArsC family reductase [Pleionea sp. HL-JVS1]